MLSRKYDGSQGAVELPFWDLGAPAKVPALMGICFNPEFVVPSANMEGEYIRSGSGLWARALDVITFNPS